MSGFNWCSWHVASHALPGNDISAPHVHVTTGEPIGACFTVVWHLIRPIIYRWRRLRTNEVACYGVLRFIGTCWFHSTPWATHAFWNQNIWKYSVLVQKSATRLIPRITLSPKIKGTVKWFVYGCWVGVKVLCEERCLVFELRVQSERI